MNFSVSIQYSEYNSYKCTLFVLNPQTFRNFYKKLDVFLTFSTSHVAFLYTLYIKERVCPTFVKQTRQLLK